MQWVTELASAKKVTLALYHSRTKMLLEYQVVKKPV